MKDIARIDQMTMHPVSAKAKTRQEAQKVADQFEAVFVQSLVSSLRQTSTVGEGSMFGSDPGADTYGDWFDQHLAEQVGKNGRVGIATAIMKDFERDGAIEKTGAATGSAAKGSVAEVAAKARAAKAAADRQSFAALRVAKGGANVVL